MPTSVQFKDIVIGSKAQLLLADSSKIHLDNNLTKVSNIRRINAQRDAVSIEINLGIIHSQSPILPTASAPIPVSKQHRYRSF